mmetsp:Transcript_22465/g.33505  ORF Transcript_22465/g.33505 Transcript_22465/m.33505 type:complete len:225 (+) Transcript_22465:202-876(+)|eukprot:CAMPEP_0167743180 /NCGR_PEP_ID=MMETSP0110_2-20121227/1869_1 /TAXON_ID=629695 /ORGANISM="Gymnochlora sp., Strain CCMP2014" /LENGTH=224 /DNA_ID=CAMNT_0007627515 /DNA_START=142 /DNA_END=816 /DNA_ORIENTATION=+
MALVPIWVAVACALSQSVALYSTFNFAVPAIIRVPECAKYLGNWIWLTFHTNTILFSFYSFSILSSLFSIPLLDTLLVVYFPLAFAMGTFLTLGYYLLDHFNPEQIKFRKQWSQRGYYHLEADAHLQHSLGAPFVWLYAYFLYPSGLTITHFNVVFVVGGFFVFYLIQIHINYYLTEKWPYPILYDMENMGGALARNAFFVALTGIYVALGLGGRAIFQYRQSG